MATAVKKAVKPKPKPTPKKRQKGKPAPKTARKKIPPEIVKLVIKEVDEALKLPENAVIDLDAYDWGGEKLTRNQKLFIVWYTTPGTKYYHRVMPAALKAGYSQKTAQVDAYKFRNDPRIDKLIRKFDDITEKVNVRDAVQRWTQEKIIRGDYKVSDYYKMVEYKDKLGRPQQKLMLKTFEELTEDQLLCLDGIDAKGMNGTLIYSLPDREKIRDNLSGIMRKEAGNEGDDEEETMEIIMERLTVKKTIRTIKDEVSQAAGLLRLPKGEAITEL